MFRVPLHRIIFVLVLALALLPVSRVIAQSNPGYLAGIPDLPLMPGLTEVPDSGVVFDKPGGRIVEAFAEGPAAAGDVAAFYDATLPQLGWQREAAGSFLREGERLRVDINEDAGGVTVQFTLRPQ